MSATAGCEGRCGVRVSGMDEVAADGLFVARHTANRCRIIRSFREAAQQLMPWATVTINASNPRRIVTRVVGTIATMDRPHGETYMVQGTLDMLALARVDPVALASIAESEARRLHHLLVNGERSQKQTNAWPPEPVLARDPHCWSRT